MLKIALGTVWVTKFLFFVDVGSLSGSQKAKLLKMAQSTMVRSEFILISLFFKQESFYLASLKGCLSYKFKIKCEF